MADLHHDLARAEGAEEEYEMLKKLALVMISVPFCVGASCGITCTDCGDISPFCPSTPVSVSLNNADCTMKITHDAGAADVDVTATIVSGQGCPVGLGTDQSVTVNGLAILGPTLTGGYLRSVETADEYVITVTEPTRGVLDTIVDDADFAITAPQDGGQASLLGFTLTWSNADASLSVKITLSQEVIEAATADFELDQDTGSKVFTADDLKDFVTGGNIIITVTRTYERNTINGFNTGKLTYERSETVSVVPVSVQ